MTKRTADALIGDAAASCTELETPANDECAQEMVNVLLPMDEILEAYRGHLRCTSCANRRRISSIVSILYDKCKVSHIGFDESDDFVCVHGHVLEDCERIVYCLRTRGVQTDQLPENACFAEVTAYANHCLGVYTNRYCEPALFSALRASLSSVLSNTFQSQVPEIVDCVAAYMDLRACALSKELLRFFVSKIQQFLADHMEALERLCHRYQRLISDETDLRRYQMVRSVVAMTHRTFSSLPEFCERCGIEATHIQLTMLLNQYNPRVSKCGHTQSKFEVLRDLISEQTRRAKAEAVRLQSLGFNVCDKMPFSK
jgi:hypothetical protein